jgi:hypothetical protein
MWRGIMLFGVKFINFGTRKGEWSATSSYNPCLRILLGEVCVDPWHLQMDTTRTHSRLCTNKTEIWKAIFPSDTLPVFLHFFTFLSFCVFSLSPHINISFLKVNTLNTNTKRRRSVDGGLLVSDALWACRWVSMFRRNIMLPSSWHPSNGCTSNRNQHTRGRDAVWTQAFQAARPTRSGNYSMFYKSRFW